VSAQTTESRVPYVFTAEAMLAATDGGCALDWDWPTLSEAFGRVGRDEAPYLPSTGGATVAATVGSKSRD
jgi:hypothetical protein